MLNKYSVKRPFTIFVAVVIVIVFGAVGLYKLTPDLFPSINAPMSIVMTSYPGASSEEIELQVTDPMEEQLATLTNLKNITSVSSDNVSIVSMEFTDDVNMDAMTVEIREKIDMIQGSLPDNASTPFVMKMNMDLMPVTVAAVGMKDKTPADVSSFIKENLESKLDGIEGVAIVTKIGMIDEGIQVKLNEKKIDDINSDVAAAINRQFNDGESKLKSGINQAKNGSKKIKNGKGRIKDAYSDVSAALRQTKASKKEAEAALEQEKAKSDPDPTVIATLEAQISALAEAIDSLEDQKDDLSFELGTTYSDLAATDSMIQSTVNQLQSTLSDIESQKQAAIDSADMTGVITMNNISGILQAQNFSMPAGYVKDGDDNVLVSVGDKIKDTEELKNLILFDMGIDGVDPIRVQDVATVSYLADDSDSYAKINGNNGVLLAFNKQSDYATATVADNVAKKFEELEKEYDNLEFTPLMDQGEYIHVVINSVFKDLLLGALFAILILLFFLRDIRPTVITAISIPVSVIFAVALMYFTGVTLNMISISGLAIGVGMLVDNSIVVIENTYRLRAKGYTPVQAAVSGAGQVAGAITASTLTTICVFVPIVFVDGMTKKIFTDLALTVTYSLLASLLIALTFVPAISKGLLIRKTKKTVLGQGGRVIRWYKGAAAWALDHRKRLVVGALVLLLASAGVLLAKGFEFMPNMSTSQIMATISMPEDSKLDDTKRVNDTICEELLKIDGVEDVGVMRTSEMNSAFGMSTSSDTGDEDRNTSLYIVMDDSKLDQCQAVSDKLDKLGKKYDCEIVATTETDITSYLGGSGVSMTLYGEDLDDLRLSGQAIEDGMRDMKALEEVSDIDKESTEEIHIVVNKNKAMEKGLTVAQVYQQIAAKVTKDTTATTMKKDNSSVDIKVANYDDKGFTKKELYDLKLTGTVNNETKKVKLTDVADINKDASMNSINHNNQKRSLTVSASVKDGYNVTKATSQVKKMINDEGMLRDGVSIKYSGENEEIMDSMKQLLLMMLVGIILVYLIMVAQFQSLRSPFIIIFTLPLAFTGGLLALLITNQVFSVIAMFGFVMLVGIVVNNGIVLVDCINRFRLEGMEMREAIIEAGAVRMRPVLMTAATTILGLVPLALGLGQGAEIVQPVAIVCIGGLLYATITTLFIIPIMYRRFARKHMEKVKEEELEIVTG